MHPIAIGVFAHVDAGKTTFCEALLAATGAISTPGRVDHQNTLLDHNALEQKRGITIYADVAAFTHNGQSFYLVDTPGHTDLAAETERALPVLDAAILLISGPAGVQGHTLTLYRLLQSHAIPTYIFINKTDQPGVHIPTLMEEIRTRLGAPCLLAESAAALLDPATLEAACEYDDDLMKRYLAEAPLGPAYVGGRLAAPIQAGALHLVTTGQALHGRGVLELLELIAATTPPKKEQEQTLFAARVFKIRYDEKGERVTLLRVISGTKQVKDTLEYDGGETEKIQQIRAYQGGGYTATKTMSTGQIVGVTGLSKAEVGHGFGCENAPLPALRPSLRVSITAPGTPWPELAAALSRLEAADPLLHIRFSAGEQAEADVMGTIQLEVLAETLAEQYGIEAHFGPARIVYMETVAAPVMGYGHFEPLRHYAEVHLRLEPAPAGTLSFASEVHTDALPLAFQRQIRHTLLDEVHSGLLTGSALTGIRFVLTAGAHHLKHTSGGDMREATRRAVRQALEKAQNTLLEPWYSFTIEVETPKAGRVLSDITRLFGVFDPPTALGSHTLITGSGPVETFLAYPAQLGILTGGAGSISLAANGWRPCHAPARIIEAAAYEKERDLANTSSSVFCSHGAGFEVKWHEAEGYMHLL